MVEPTPLFDTDFEDRVADAASARAVEGLDYDQKEAARAMQLQRMFKVPAPIISGDLEGFERQQKTKLIHEMVRDNPAIQDYINGNPLAARISQDDYPQLDTWHRSMREFVRPPAVFDRVESGLKQVGQSFVQGISALTLKSPAIAGRNVLEARKEGLDEATSSGGFDAEDPASRAAFRQRRGVIHPTGEVVEERRKTFEEATAKPVEEHPLYQAGLFVDEVAKYLMPTNPEFKDEFFASKLPQAFGSIASFIIGGGLISATTKAPAAFTIATAGSLQQGVSQFEDAIEHGATIQAALEASGYGNLIGTSEALPIVHFLDRLDKTTGGSFKKAVGRILLQGTEEFVQEFGQKVGENVVANKLVGYDPTRGTFTGAMDDASVGFTAGAIMQTIAEMIGGKRAKVSAQSVANRIKTANAYLAEGKIPPVGIDPFFDLQHAEQAKSDLGLLKDLISASNKTQTKELSPELAEAFAKQGVGEFKIGIPPEAVLELYGSKQPSADDGLLGFISDLDDQLEIAAQTGGDVEISLAQYLAHVDQDVDKTIQEHLRLREGGMTAKEAEAFKEAKEEEAESVEGFHGSTDIIGEFDPAKTRLDRGVFFSEKPELASKFAEGRATDSDPLKIFGEDDPAEIVKWVREISGNSEAARIEGMIKEYGALPNDDVKYESSLSNDINDELRKISAMSGEVGGGSPNVTKAKLKLGKTHTVDMGGKFSWDKEREGIDFAKANGFDSVTFTNAGEEGKFYTVFNKEQVTPGFGEAREPSSIDELARREAGLDIYASRVRQQVSLKKVSEEIDEDNPGDPPFSTFHIMNDQGQQVGDVTVQLTGKNVLYVQWIGGYKPNPSYKDVAMGTPHVFGLHSTMSLFEQLAKEYPTATAIGGWRATGARQKADTTGWAQMPLEAFRKDPQKAAEFLAQIQKDKEVETIVSPAVVVDGKVFDGKTGHEEAFSNAYNALGRPDVFENFLDKYWKPGKGDGFVTSTGRYVERDEAYKIAEAAEQLYEETEAKDWLEGANFKPRGKVGQEAPAPEGSITSDIDGLEVQWRPAEFLTADEKKATEIFGKIKQMIAPNAVLGVVDKIKGKAAGVAEESTFAGIYHSSSQAILVAMNGPHQVGTLLHEFIHHLRDGFFKPEEWAQLEREAIAGDWIKKHQIDTQYGTGSKSVQLEEAIAEEFREWFEKTIGGKDTKKREFTTPPEAEKLFQKIASLLGRIKDFIRKQFGDDITADKLFHQVVTGEIGNREPGQRRDEQVRGMVMKSTQDEEQQMFERGSALGMTQEQFRRFTKLLEKRQEEINERAKRRAEAKADLRKTQEWKEYLPKAREQAEAEVINSPAIRVDEYFRSGKVDGVEVDKIRLGKEFLTREQQEALGANIYSKDGVDPNDVSWLFGFNSGQAMIHAMASVRAERAKSGLTIAAFKERLIADRQQELMAEKFLGPAVESELKDAREDILTETQMDMLHEELLAAMLQAKQFDPAMGAPFSKDDVKKAAKAAFQNIPVKRAVKMEQYLKDAGKAGNAAFAAMLKQDYAEALRQKQRQILSTFFAAESKALVRAKNQVESQANRFKPREVKNVDFATTVFVKRLLSKAGFRVNRSDEELDEGMDIHGFASLDTFVQSMRGDGWEITIPDYLAREEVKPLEEMIVEELYDFKDAIVSMATAGKGIRTVLSAGEARDFDDYKQDVLRRVKSRPMRDIKVPVRRAYTWDAMLTRMEEIAKDLDGRDEPNGPLYNVLIRGTAEAKHMEYSLQEKLVEKLNAIKGFAKGWRGSLKETIQNDLLIDPRTGAFFDLTRGDLIGIMLNFGSESNIEKFTAGFIDRSAIPGESRKDRSKRLKGDAQFLANQLEVFIDRNATKEDRQFTQAIWDIFHDWQPMINEMYTELSGVGPKMIPPRKVQSQHGSYKGGYFPILWDQMRSNINVVEEENTSLNKLFSGNYFKATVANHYTKTRTDAVDVVAFSNITEQLGQRMQQVIHDLAYRRAIMEVNKVIYDKEIRAAIRDHYGKEYADQLEPWVKDIANHFNSNERAIEGLNWALRAMRFNTIAHVLPFNIKTILSPSVGLMNPAAIMRTLFRPQESVREAWDKSQEIPHTFRNMNRDMREKMDTLIESHRWDSFVAEAVRWGFRPIVKLEQGFRITTFLDTYKKAIAAGETEDDARALGDSAVRTHHGAHGLPDLPAIMRSSEAAKVFTMFYGYFSTMHNWRRQMPDAVRRRDWDTMMTVAWGTTLLPALFSMALYNKYDGDDEDGPYFRWVRNFVKAVGLESAGGIPGVREAANYWLEWQEPKTALEGLVKAVAITGRDIKRFAEGKDVKAPVQHTMNTIGLATGLPLGQAGRTIQGIRDVQTGAQDAPRNIWQWFNLITHGRAEEKKRR